MVLSKNGLQVTPKTTRQKRYTCKFPSSACTFSYQRNRKESLSASLIDIMRNAFSLSEVKTMGNNRKRVSISAVVRNKQGP